MLSNMLFNQNIVTPILITNVEYIDKYYIEYKK